MNDLFSSWKTAASLSSGTLRSSQISVNEIINSSNDNITVANYTQVKELINESIASLKVYVLESDITDSQNTVKSIVSQATF